MLAAHTLGRFVAIAGQCGVIFHHSKYQTRAAANACRSCLVNVRPFAAIGRGERVQMDTIQYNQALGIDDVRAVKSPLGARASIFIATCPPRADPAAFPSSTMQPCPDVPLSNHCRSINRSSTAHSSSSTTPSDRTLEA
jgi:hypothetical protein